MAGIDVDAHHIVWGSTDLNLRGRLYVSISQYAQNFIVQNKGKAPTFITSVRKEVSDHTICNISMVSCQKGICAKRRFFRRQFKVFWLLCSVLFSRLYKVTWNYKVLLNMKSILFSMVPFIFQNSHSYWYYISYILFGIGVYALLSITTSSDDGLIPS